MRFITKNKSILFGLLFFFFCTFACSTGDSDRKTQGDSSSEQSEAKLEQTIKNLDETSSTRPGALNRETALARSKQLSKISYLLWFGLNPLEGTYSGRSVIQFEVKPKAKDFGKKIFVDFEDGAITSMKINGSPVTDFKSAERYDRHRIYFNLNELTNSTNRIEIAFQHAYSKTGYGLHEFKDPIDQNIYLYSDFEPYHAHQMFPCFDQPDLKASYELTVEAPEEWQVISNTIEREVNHVDGRKSWIFPQSPIFSTYIFALHAGPYSSWKSEYNGIPLRLFARKSLSKYIDHQEWLKVTREGLGFFETQFGFSYPFGKYDQIIVPDFNAGAMENVGAVTFSERMVYRTRVTEDKRRRRADTILHEMAHQWFGDLVTMKWWNGLWLNESFATLMAAWAVDEATDFKGSWESFFLEKQWAYWEDQLVTTHPIELPVPDTDAAESNFDGITYGKGAATLKQLKFFIGEEDFREGLQRYFQKYSYKNTTLSDFVKMLSEASSTDLTKWQSTWLQTAGVNPLKADWECSPDPKTMKSLISKFDLVQQPANASHELRPHRTQIGLYNFPKGQNKHTAPLVVSKPIPVEYSGSSTPVKEAIGQPCPDLVYPNFDDYDYAKIELDPVSQKRSFESLGQISNSLTRQMIWHTLWEMVIDGKIKAQDFAETALSQSKSENNTVVLNSLATMLTSASLNKNSVIRFLSGDLRNQYRKKIETWFKSRLLSSPEGTDKQLIWYTAFLESASTPQGVRFLNELLGNQVKISGIPMDQEHRWEVIRALARNGSPGIQKIIEDELKKDPTDMGQKAAIAAESAIPDSSSKAKWLSQLTRKSGELPLAKLREAMLTYHEIGQETYTDAAVDAYFTTLPELALSPDPSVEEYSKWFAKGMYPSLCEQKIVDRTTALLNSQAKLPAPVVKELKVHRQEEERCIRARAKSSE